VISVTGEKEIVASVEAIGEDCTVDDSESMVVELSMPDEVADEVVGAESEPVDEAISEPVVAAMSEVT
jgi:hypothetical protein